MRRVSRQACEDGPLLEEQETEGQRQLHSLLLQQLHTEVDIERCLAKRQCFAPAALYRPFGEQAAGVRSLTQFQALQDGEKELTSLRELGLTDAEIQLWRSRDQLQAAEKSHGVCAAPEEREQRLQVIRDKMDARAELLSRPQRFAASQPLSRREMEIERALFQGNDRQGFLAALYHRDEDKQDGQQGASSSHPMDCLYRDVLADRAHAASRQETQPPKSPHRTGSDQSPDPKTANMVQSEEGRENGSTWQRDRSESTSETSETRPPDDPPRVEINQPIGSLRGAMRAGSEEPLTLRGDIQKISEQEILQNRESEEEIRRINRFQNHQAGKPSKVLCVKNLSAQASAAQLVALFSRFEPENGPAVVYRLLTGRLKGQAFITLSDAETAQNALQLIHGYRLLGKPLVVEFGREKQEVEKQKQTQK